MKTIGVLTSGGDAPGMNAAVCSIVRSAEAMGIKVKGVMKGYNGLIENHFVDLDIRSIEMSESLQSRLRKLRELKAVQPFSVIFKEEAALLLATELWHPRWDMPLLSY